MIAAGILEQRHLELLNGKIIEIAPERESHTLTICIHYKQFNKALKVFLEKS